MISYYIVNFKIQPGAKQICTSYRLARSENEAIWQVLEMWPFMELVECVSEDTVVKERVKLEYKNWAQYIEDLKKVKL